MWYDIFNTAKKKVSAKRIYEQSGKERFPLNFHFIELPKQRRKETEKANLRLTGKPRVWPFDVK